MMGNKIRSFINNVHFLIRNHKKRFSLVVEPFWQNNILSTLNFVQPAHKHLTIGFQPISFYKLFENIAVHELHYLHRA